MAGLSRRGFAIRAVVCGLLCSGLPAACGLPEYRFVDETSTGGAPGVTRPRCAINADCARYSSTKTCDASGHCVECLDGTDSASCASGLFCNVNHCEVGCAANAPCPNGLTCNESTHQCEGCTGDGDCPLGTGCQSGKCVSGCSVDAEGACPEGLLCCNGACVGLGSDPLHCGSCTKACADRQDCINGICGEGTGCKEGFDDCDGKPGCEVNLRNDRKNCGSCFVDCGDKYCSGGTCSSINCSDPLTADCDNDESTGCETLLTSTDDCGTCHNKCSDFHGTPACVDRKCAITCDPNFKDCDQNAATGCEADLLNDDANCGACNVACSNENGRTKCVDGACVPACNAGFGDCDGIPENGCEAEILGDIHNCGACSKSCVVPHASALCDQGVCKNQCETNFEDCNGGDDGCETDLTLPESCGTCGVVCNSNGGTAKCVEGACAITCKPGYADCVNGLDDGCETNITTNVNNCGACGTGCTAPPSGSAACVSGTCMLTNCTAPLADCDANGSCETNTTTSVKHCGGCGIECTFGHASATCVNKVCTIGTCETGYADCTAANGCETKLGDKLNCTKCGDACLDNHASNSCGPTGCAPTCEIGWGDCDGNPNNGCETQLNTLTDCGKCKTACTLPHATTSCASGTCQITSCATNFGDCDSEIPTPNGCETPLTSLANCGACRKQCDIVNAAEDCSTGTCQLASCNTGYADCSSTLAGCETPLGTSTNCAVCNDACQTSNVHVTQNVCAGTAPNAACSPTCQPGFKSCDGNPSNGCETDITTPMNCGDCFAACSLPNTSTYQCVSGGCQVATCKPGFANCDTTQSNGCEQPTSSDINNCGNCLVKCSSNHGTPSCTNGACSTACQTGWGDCNTDRLDGCEHDVTSDPNACGNCATKCSGGTPFCVSSACRSHLTIGVGTPTTGNTAGTTLTIMHTLKASNAYRVVVVGVAGRGNGSFGRPSSVKYGNVATNMTLEREFVSSNQAWSGIYTLRNSLLPAVNTTSAVVITPGSSSGTFGMIASVVELTNVEQATSWIDGVGGSAHGQCSGTLTDTISTATDGSLIYGVVGFYGAFTTAGTSSGQTLLLQPTTVNGLGGIAGYVLPGAPVSNFQFSWTPNACDTSSQTLVAFKPAVTP